MTKMLRIMWAPFGWLLRVATWVAFFPAGIWLSWKHRAKKRDRQTMEATREMHRETIDAMRQAQSLTPEQIDNLVALIEAREAHPSSN
jgi:4-alpha-glucanotransferase